MLRGVVTWSGLRFERATDDPNNRMVRMSLEPWAEKPGTLVSVGDGRYYRELAQTLAALFPDEIEVRTPYK